jgi:p-hydroxybenzoate 3-monooxygenase
VRLHRRLRRFPRRVHSFPDDLPIAAKLREAELDYLLHSKAGARTIAENYVGLPLDFGEALVS